MEDDQICLNCHTFCMKGWVTGKRGQKWLLVDNEMPQWLVLSYGDEYSLHYIICIIHYSISADPIDFTLGALSIFNFYELLMYKKLY